MAAQTAAALLLLTDGHTVVATTCGHSLWLRSGAGTALVSSEPLDDDPTWRQVPDRHLVVATALTADVSPLSLKETV